MESIINYEMQPFLHEVAEDIINNFNNLNDYCIVFPNKRTSTFFKKYYAQIIQKSSWAPNLFTIDSLLKKFSDINTKSKLPLLIDLYQIAKEVFNKTENKDYFNYFTFDKFFSLGEIILNDFNDVDNYLIEAKDLFRNIKNIEEIDLFYNYLTDYQKEILREFWMNFSSESKSEEKRKFMMLWENLPEIYEKFGAFLLSNKSAYGGLRNRYLTDLIKENKLDTNSFTKYIFVGFNALNKAEKELFKYLHSLNKAVFYWDYDNYYTEDIKQEAGFFMRDNLKAYPEQLTENKVLLNNPEKKVQIIGVPLHVGQAKVLSTILSDLENKDESFFNKTAIILADEHLLFPVLHSLPTNIPSVNITMGYPLKETTIYGLLIDYIQIQQISSTNKQKNVPFYFKDVIKILKHPEIWSITKDLSKLIIKDIEEKNRIYLTREYFSDYKNELLNLIFSPVHNSESPVNLLLTNILNILFVIFNKSENKATKTIENEYIYQVYIEIKKLRDIIEIHSEKIDFNFKISIKLLRQILSDIRIPFTGEHSDGLQVMGLMETRNLDFENVIILSVNEGVLPDTGRKPSFISDNLRIAFELPVIKYQDSIFAYFFYRIIQRAENVTIIYNSIICNNSGEISRFIQQLKFESKLNIVEKQFKQDLIPFVNQTISINKNKQIISYLNSYLTDTNLPKKHFSASALNTYIDCKLKFYYKYIALIKTKTVVEEEITPVTFGTILHSAIEKLYSDFTERKKNKTIDQTDFSILKSHLEEYTEKAFKEYYQIPENSKFIFEGTNIIIQDVVIQHLTNILKIDSNYSPFQIIDLEQKNGYTAEIKVLIEDKLQKVSLWGIFDRVDLKDEIYRIIDYKTGSTDKYFSSIESLFNPLNTNRQTAIFQMFYYSYILTQKFDTYKGKISPGIYNIREMSTDSFSPNLIYKPDRDTKIIIDHNTLTAFVEEFEENLSSLLSEIFNPYSTFSQTENKTTCSFCDFKEICNR